MHAESLSATFVVVTCQPVDGKVASVPDGSPDEPENEAFEEEILISNIATTYWLDELHGAKKMLVEYKQSCIKEVAHDCNDQHDALELVHPD